jgi:hypothetical protein
LVCVKPDLDELPETLECDFGRGLQLSRSGAELNVVLNPVLAKETSVGSSGKPGPSRFTLRRANAITTAYDPALFDPGVRYQPNSSTESRRLEPLVGKQRLRPVTREWLEAGVRRAGFDPMSLSLNGVNRLRSHIEEKLNSCCDPSWLAASEAEREHVLGERLQDALDQAHERMRRWQERRKGP